MTKYNAAIMERNWVHIQDGTEFEGKFDLTATSSESFEVGQVVSLEGILALNMILAMATAMRYFWKKQQRSNDQTAVIYPLIAVT